MGLGVEFSWRHRGPTPKPRTSAPLQSHYLAPLFKCFNALPAIFSLPAQFRAVAGNLLRLLGLPIVRPLHSMMWLDRLRRPVGKLLVSSLTMLL